jgi:RHS repeat-associated protein
MPPFHTRRPSRPKAAPPPQLRRPRTKRRPADASADGRTRRGPLNGTTRYLWGGDSDWQCLEERGSGGNLVARYTYSPGYIDAVAEQERDLDADSDFADAGEVVYYHANALFSTYALTDAGGSVVERYRYDAYGAATVLDPDWSVDADGASDVGNPYAYTGRRLDAASGLLQYRFRFYCTALGRWMQRDSVGYVDGMSLYEYVMGEPVGLVDASELSFRSFFSGIGHGISVGAHAVGHAAVVGYHAVGHAISLGAQEVRITHRDASLMLLLVKQTQWYHDVAQLVPQAILVTPIGAGVEGPDLLAEAVAAREAEASAAKAAEEIAAAKAAEEAAATRACEVKASGSVIDEIDRLKADDLSGRAGITATEERLTHVLERHFPGGAESAGKSLFNAGEDVSALMRGAESVNPVAQKVGTNFQRVVHAGRIIGVDRTTGQATAVYTVITYSAGNMVAMFPGMPAP